MGCRGVALSPSLAKSVVRVLLAHVLGKKSIFWGWCRDGDVVVLPARGHGLATHGESEWAAPRRGDKRHSKGR